MQSFQLWSDLQHLTLVVILLNREERRPTVGGSYVAENLDPRSGVMWDSAQI